MRSTRNYLKFGAFSHMPEQLPFFNIFFRLQSLDGFEHLLYLISICHSFVILNIDTRVTQPKSFVDPMTANGLPGFTKGMVTYFAQVTETYSFGVPVHRGENFFIFAIII